MSLARSISPIPPAQKPTAKIAVHPNLKSAIHNHRQEISLLQK
jgi:hypothetical protein